MTNVPNLRFKEFTEEWEKYIISDFMEFYPTNSLSWDQLDYKMGSIYNLHYGLIHNGLPKIVNMESCIIPFIKVEYTPKNYMLCQDGDIAFADASEDTNDVAKVIEFQNCGSRSAICGLHTIHGRDKAGITVYGFKAYAFSSASFHNQIKRIAQGTKVYSISQKNFSKISIGIPSKQEQEKIAKLLLLLDERISTQSQIIKDLKLLKCAIINKMFCSENNDIPQIRFPQYNVLWKKFKLKDVCKRVTTKNKSLTCTLVLTVAAQYGLIDQETFFNKQIASDNLCNYYLLAKGDFAYNKSYSNNYPWGAIKRLDAFDNGVLSTLYICFRPNNEINSDFLVHYFETNKWYKGISDIAGEGARNHGLLNISIDDYFATSHKIPHFEEQCDIALFLNKLSSKLEIEEKQSQNYQYQKVYLLESLFK